MALCVYHETTEAVSVCTGCKQDICAKCREYGANGMCGMCLEMHNARTASLEASRIARQEAASAAPQRPPAGTRPAKAPPPKAPPRPPRPPAPPGMCQEHPDQRASAACTHCKKKVCPYCLDLYDHCPECRTLPACVRHESMVARDRCVACKMHFCSICLDNTDRCDRCRTLGLTGDAAEAKEGPRQATQRIKPPNKNTTKLTPPPEGAPAPAAAKAPPRPRPGGKRSAAYRPPQKKAEGIPPVFVLGALGLVLVVIGFMALGGGGKKAFSPEEAAKLLKADMAYVQQAAIALKESRGAYPDSEEQLLAEVKRQGVDPAKLQMPIKLTVNAQPDEPLEISYRLVGTGFELRALDQDGRPFAIDGRDVILTHEKR